MNNKTLEEYSVYSPFDIKKTPRNIYKLPRSFDFRRWDS